jgi:acetolactate synthase-1/2/3 large subunit
MDLQRKILSNVNLENKGLAQNYLPKKKSDNSFTKLLVDSMAKSQKPILYIGNGCRSDEALKLLKIIIDKLQIPFFVSWSAIDLFPNDNLLNMGRIGLYGDRAANITLQKADLVLCLGTRLAIPQVGYSLADFARNATKWIVDIDETECNKFDDPKYQQLYYAGLFFKVVV